MSEPDSGQPGIPFIFCTCGWIQAEDAERDVRPRRALSTISGPTTPGGNIEGVINLVPVPHGDPHRRRRQYLSRSPAGTKASLNHFMDSTRENATRETSPTTSQWESSRGTQPNQEGTA